MTYIASVKAKKGVAIIADSLVTSMHKAIEEVDFRKLLEKKQKESDDKDISLSLDEIAVLFRSTPSHTKDFENKLMELDKYSAITTAGSAIINNKHIDDFIESYRFHARGIKGYPTKNIENKIKVLKKFIEDEVRKHIAKYGSIYTTILILTHYDKKNHLTRIFKIIIQASTKEDIKRADHVLINVRETEGYEKVVCEGQNGISEDILFGDFYTVWSMVPRIAEKVFKDFEIPKNKIPKDYIKKLQTEHSDMIYEGVQLLKLKELSLQQAVDLAWLLINIEIDFQKYTQNIPTVGGVIKLAIIDENGFRYISGHEITKPTAL